MTADPMRELVEAARGMREPVETHPQHGTLVRCVWCGVTRNSAQGPSHTATCPWARLQRALAAVEGVEGRDMWVVSSQSSQTDKQYEDICMSEDEVQTVRELSVHRRNVRTIRYRAHPVSDSTP